MPLHRRSSGWRRLSCSGCRSEAAAERSSRHVMCQLRAQVQAYVLCVPEDGTYFLETTQTNPQAPKMIADAHSRQHFLGSVEAADSDGFRLVRRSQREVPISSTLSLELQPRPRLRSNGQRLDYKRNTHANIWPGGGDGGLCPVCVMWCLRVF